MDAIDSTFVSSVGESVNRFERDLAAFTGAARAVATVNGTCALQTALTLVGVKSNDEVITQPLTNKGLALPVPDPPPKTQYPNKNIKESLAPT